MTGYIRFEVKFHCLSKNNLIAKVFIKLQKYCVLI